ncbi:MAG: hypothetical protein Kow0089_07640 [Desulfobulbaceae bacterium]
MPEECYYGLRNLLESGAREAADRIVARLPLPDIFFSARFCVREAAMLLHLCRLLDLPLPVSSGELADWLRSCQNGDGGFGFYPHTTSFIENTHAALEALALLGAGPLHPQRAFDYLIGCRTACGGFGRGSRTAPFLDATWHGVAGLSLAAGFLSA